MYIRTHVPIQELKFSCVRGHPRSQDSHSLPAVAPVCVRYVEGVGRREGGIYDCYWRDLYLKEGKEVLWNYSVSKVDPKLESFLDLGYDQLDELLRVLDTEFNLVW